ncbi:MAG: tRNA (guanine(10)-N(2))-dimethyltransferase [Candidatus Bathyarchaeota archaeon]|nr:tRNA (guanine(10)-N(2))-dimethyltransferase [Candidatus Bathyarchaeota archaeon]
MSFGFPTETIKEGEIKAVVPKLETYREKPQDYAPSKAPVFYNPVMELNRDFAVLALQAHQKTVDREIRVSEPLTGCGLRGVRFAVEVSGVCKVVLNDINPQSVKITKHNAELNGVEDKVEVCNLDANLFLTQHAAPKKRLDYVDVDPFGTPVVYMDSALRALRNGGMIALTATDMAPLCGVHRKACIRKYGGTPLRTEYCHELAVRLLVGCTAVMAAKHEIGINVLFSHSIDHYVRAYATVSHGAKVADKSVQQMGYILHCFSCFHRETVQGIVSPLKQVCPNCGAKLSVAGPLWLGKIADQNFCATMEEELGKRNLKKKNKLLKTLTLIRNEADAPVTYYGVDKICDKLNLPISSQTKVMNGIKAQGFVAIPTHFNSRGIKTDAPTDVVKDVITKLAQKMGR